MATADSAAPQQRDDEASSTPRQQQPPPVAAATPSTARPLTTRYIGSDRNLQQFELLSSVPRAPRACLSSRVALSDKNPAPGPGSYDVSLSWDKGCPRMQTAKSKSLVDRFEEPAPYYDVTPSKPNAVKIASRHSDMGERTCKSVPGPGAYNISRAIGADAKPRPAGALSTFGDTHKAPKKLMRDNPGPGAYDPVFEAASARSLRSGGSPRIVSLPSIGPAFSVPGPGSYELPTCFPRVPEHGRIHVTMKGRLAHPMDDKNAAHDCAKTDHPHVPAKKFKSHPRLSGL